MAAQARLALRRPPSSADPAHRARAHRARARAEDSLEAARPALEALVCSAAHRLAHLLPASPLEACLVEELQRAQPPHPPLGLVELELELQSPAMLQSHPCLEVPQPEPLQQHPQPRRLVALEVRISPHVHRDILIWCRRFVNACCYARCKQDLRPSVYHTRGTPSRLSPVWTDSRSIGWLLPGRTEQSA